MITYHNKTEYYTNLADRPGAPTYGVGSCFVGAVEYLSDGATWAAAATVDTGAGALLTGFSASAGAVAATDSILIGFNKVVANVALRALNLITGYTSGAGVIAATDTVLQAIQKLDGNIALRALNLLTGYTSGAGVIAATDTVLQAIQKIDGNIALRALNLLTGYISDAGVIAATDTVLQAIQKLDGNIALKQTTMNVATADYYVAVTSDGSAITKLTFVNGLLTQVTPP